MSTASSSMGTSSKELTLWHLEPPEWRLPLLSVAEPASTNANLPSCVQSAYPEFFPGATALYPQPFSSHSASTSSHGNYAGHGRDSSSGQMGVAGVTMAREDDLSESVVKSGFVSRTHVQTEGFSAQQHIRQRLLTGPTLPALAKIVQKVIERQKIVSNAVGSPSSKKQILPSIGPWSYKSPSRVVLNEARREAWFLDLANPSVPLSKLAKSIPNNPASASTGGAGLTSSGSGLYGSASRINATGAVDKACEKNLDLVVSRNIPLDRAIWYLQCVGQAEISQSVKSSLRLSSSSSQSSSVGGNAAHAYTLEFTNATLDLLRKQLQEVIMPVTHAASLALSRPGMVVKGRARNVLADGTSREKWQAKWIRSLELAELCQKNDLLCNARWVSGLCDMWKTANMAQLGLLGSVMADFVLPLIDTNIYLGFSLVDSTVDRLSELTIVDDAEPETSSSQQPLCRDEPLIQEVTSICNTLLLDIFNTFPEALYRPNIWADHAKREILEAAIAPSLATAQTSPSQSTLALWSNLKKRIDQVLGVRSLISTDCLSWMQESAVSLKSDSKPQSLEIDFTSACTLVAWLDAFEPTDSSSKFFDEISHQSAKPQPTSFQPHSPIITSQPATDLLSPATKRPPINRADRTSDLTTPQTLHVMLAWAVSSTRQGAYGRSLVINLLKSFVTEQTGHSGRFGSENFGEQERRTVAQRAILQWLDEAALQHREKDELIDSGSKAAIASLIGYTALFVSELCEHGLLDYGAILQHALTCSDTVHTSIGMQHQTPKLFYRYIIRQLPISSPSPPLQFQLTRFLKDSVSHNADVSCLAELQQVARKVMPILCGSEPQNASGTGTLAESRGGSDVLVPYLERAEVGDVQKFFEWLSQCTLDAASAIADGIAELSSALSLWIHNSVVTLLVPLLSELCEGYVLHRSMLQCLSDVFRSQISLWTVMGCLDELFVSLYKAHRRFVNSIFQPWHFCKTTLVTLVEISPKVSPDVLNGTKISYELALDVDKLHKALNQTAQMASPDWTFDIQVTVLDEIRRHVNTWIPASTASLAESYWKMYGSHPQWCSDIATCILIVLEDTTNTPAAEALAQLWLAVDDLSTTSNESKLPDVMTSALSTCFDEGQGPKVQYAVFLSQLVTYGVLTMSSLVQEYLMPLLTATTKHLSGEAGTSALQIIRSIKCANQIGRLLHNQLTETSATTFLKVEAALEIFYTSAQICEIFDLLISLCRLESVLQARNDEVHALLVRELRLKMPRNDRFQRLFMRNLVRVSEKMLDTSGDDMHTAVARVDVLRDVIKALKSRSGVQTDPIGPISVPTSDSTKHCTLSAEVVVSRLDQMELQAYLKHLEMSKTSEQFEDPVFAQRFLEGLLNRPDSLTNGSGQLSAFTGSGADQLLHATILCLVQDMENLITGGPAGYGRLPARIGITCSIFRRIMKQATQLRVSQAVTTLLQQTFTFKWAQAFDHVRSYSVAATTHGWRMSKESMMCLLVLCESLCLAMRYGDLWTENEDLLESAVDGFFRLLADFQLSSEHAQQMYDMLVRLKDYTPESTWVIIASRWRQREGQTTNSYGTNHMTVPLLLSSEKRESTCVLENDSGEMFFAPERPWDQLGGIEPTARDAREKASSNNGPIDLHKMQADIVDLAPQMQNLPPINTDQRSAKDSNFRIADQGNFDAEIPILQESMWQRDFRRSLTVSIDANSAVSNVSVPMTAEDVSRNKDKPLPSGNNSAPAIKANVSSLASTSIASSTAKTAPNTSAPKRAQANKKRKPVPEVIIDDESPKRRKVASKTTKKK